MAIPITAEIPWARIQPVLGAVIPGSPYLRKARKPSTNLAATLPVRRPDVIVGRAALVTDVNFTFLMIMIKRPDPLRS